MGFKEMTVQKINYGQVPNDGTGDKLRDAFKKTDDNFTDLDTRKANAQDVVDALAFKADKTYVNTELAKKADLASPALTGTPTAPTASAATNTTQLATTAFVQAVKAADTGSAATAVALKTPRTINGVSFNGTANITINAVDATSRIASSEKGAANGVATLDATGKVPSTQLPSYVDDVLEFPNLASFPSTGESGKIYVALDTNKTYRWSGSAYVYITSGAVDSVAGKTGVVTLVKADVGLSNVDNTTDSGKPVSIAQQAALDTKVDKVAGQRLLTDAEGTKLANIAEQATKNATDAALRDRSTHTGTQAISTVTGLQTALDGKAALDSKNAFTNTTASTSTTTGAATFAGGVGVAGAVHAGSTPNWLSGGTQVPPMAFIRDAYRQQVEAASGGRQTVLYTAKGQPSIMSIFPAFNLEGIDASLGTGVHPMFVVGGVRKAERFIGTYPGSVVNGELLSLPAVDPSASRNFDSFVSVARSNGAGWGLMTNVDWAGLALWCWKNGSMPRGNTNYGFAHDAPHETARRMDGFTPGTATGTPRSLTGSGPATWRHDGTPAGIADLCGNIWEWAPGMRLQDGEIHVIADNDAALTATDLSATSSAWKAIDGATGDLVAKGHANAVKIAASGTGNYTLVCGSGSSFEGMTNPGATPVSAAALQKLKAMGIFPVANSGLGGDGIWHSLSDERLPFRGGSWFYGAGAGVFALFLRNLRSSAGTDIGSRPAFVI